MRHEVSLKSDHTGKVSGTCTGCTFSFSGSSKETAERNKEWHELEHNK